MMLGKRPRPNLIKRTTSMTEFTLDPIPAQADDDQIDGTTVATPAPPAVQPQPPSVLKTTTSPWAPAPLAPPPPPSPVLADPRFSPAVALSNAGMEWPSAAEADESGGREIGVQMMRRRHSADFVEDANDTTPHFLRDCSLCKSRLGPGRDIYMYRGDSAFCSLECRQQQISRDLRKERTTSAANRDLVKQNSTTAPSPNLPTEPVAATAAAV